MGKAILIAVGILIAAGICYVGCSKEDRASAMDRVHNAGTALNGGDVQDDKEHATPTIVAEQQRKERIRQNTKWTKENQALHPVEYAQAQLAEMDRLMAQEQVRIHTLATTKASEERKFADAQTQAKFLAKFLGDAKGAYRTASATNKWPVAINGFTLTQESLKEKIVTTDSRLRSLTNSLAKTQNGIAMLNTKLEKAHAEQQSLVASKERVQMAISDLNAKQVIDGDKSIADALNSINDSMKALDVDNSDPSVGDMATPSEAATRDQKFDEIMAE